MSLYPLPASDTSPSSASPSCAARAPGWPRTGGPGGAGARSGLPALINGVVVPAASARLIDATAEYGG